MYVNEIFGYYDHCVDLVSTDIKYTKKNASILNSVDLGNMFESILSKLNPLLKNQRIFRNQALIDKIRSVLTIKSTSAHKDKSSCVSASIYAPFTDLNWYVYSIDTSKTRYDSLLLDKSSRKTTLTNRKIPDNSLIIFNTDHIVNEDSSVIFRKYARQGTVKDFLVILNHLKDLLSDFTDSVSKMKKHMKALNKSTNDDMLSQYVGIGLHATIE